MEDSENIIGHDKSYNELVFLYKNNSLPNKILLTGNSGIGKNLLVDKFINYVFNHNKLIKSNVHPNILKIKKKMIKKILILIK